MAGGKSYLAAAKPDKSFFQEKAKDIAPALVTDRTSTGPAPVKVAPASMTAGYANAAKSGMAQNSYTNKLAVWNKKAAPSLAAQPTVSAPGSFAHVAASRAPDVIPTAWKKDSKIRSTARATSPSSDSSLSSISANTSSTPAPIISTKGPNPVPASNKKPLSASANSSGNSIKMVIPKGMPAQREPLNAPPGYMTAAARREKENAEILGLAAFGGKKSTQDSRRLLTPPASLEGAKLPNVVEKPLSLESPPKSAMQVQPANKANSPTKKTAAKDISPFKLAVNGGAAHLSAPVSGQSSAKTVKATDLSKKSYSDMAASTPPVLSDKAEDETKVLTLQPKATQQLVANEKKSRRKNKKSAKSTETATAPPSVAQADFAAKKFEEKKANSTKNVDVKDAVATLAVTSTACTVSISAENTQSIEEVSTPAMENAVPTEPAKDVAPQCDAPDAPVITKTGRKNKKSGAQRKKEKKARAPEQAAAIAAANAAADLAMKIATQIATIKGLAESDAARRELPMGFYDIQYAASRDSEDVMALNKQRAEEALRAALHENAAKEAGHCVKVVELPSYMWFYDTCAQPILQSRAAELLKTADSDSEVESIASPPKGTVKQQQMAKKKDIKLKMAIAEDPVAEASTSVLEKLSLPSPTHRLSFGMSSSSAAPVLSVLRPLAANYDLGTSSDTPFVFGKSIVPEVTEVEASEHSPLNAVANQSTATSPPVVEVSESEDITTDTDADTSLASDEESSPTDDESEPTTTKKKTFEPLPAATENSSSFKTGTALVLAVGDEVRYVEKVTEPYMPVAIYHGSALPVFASSPPVSADKNPIEIPQIVITSDNLKAFVPALPRAVFGPFVAPKAGLDIPLPAIEFRLAAYIGTLRNVPDGLPATLQLPAVPTHEPAELERTVAVFTPPAPIRTPRTRPTQYHLNTQIGITTLREFLNVLRSPYAQTYSRVELIDAWILLSNVERAALDLGQPLRWTSADVRRNKALEHKIFLGYVKLEDFLKMMVFDVGGNTTVSEVFRAFEDCADLDEGAVEMEMRHENT